MRMPIEWLKGYSLFALGGGALVLLGIVAGSFAYSSRMQEEAGSALGIGRLDRLLVEFTHDLVDAETAQRGYIITRHDDFLEPYRAALDAFHDDAGELMLRARELEGQLSIDPAAIRDVVTAGQRKLDMVSRNLAELKSGELGDDQLLATSRRGKELMDDVRDRVDAIRDVTSVSRNGHALAMRAAGRMLVVMNSLGAGLIVILAAGAMAVIRRHVRGLDAARRDLAATNESLEARVAERTEALTRSNEELQRYAYVVSHDLRAPLVNVMGFTSELEADVATLTGHLRQIGRRIGDPDSEAAFAAAEHGIPQALRFIRSSTGRMDALIHEILTLSRAGRRLLEPVEIDTGALVENCIAAIRQRFDSVGAKVTVDRTMPVVVSDSLALEQIFSNLLDNAGKFLVDGRAGRISVSGRLVGALARFEITDNGRGVGAGEQEAIFELFRRVGDTDDRPGEGIGLTHARVLARRLGGDIGVESDGESGSTFVVTIARDLAARLDELPGGDAAPSPARAVSSSARRRR